MPLAVDIRAARLAIALVTTMRDEQPEVGLANANDLLVAVEPAVACTAAVALAELVARTICDHHLRTVAHQLAAHPDQGHVAL